MLLVGRKAGEEMSVAVPRLSRTTAVIQAFAQTGRKVILSCLSRRSCIASVRVTVECLKRFGVAVRPVAVRFLLEIPDLKLMYTSGLSPEEIVKAQGAESFLSLPAGDGGGWNGHLVAAGNGFLIDPSFDQGLAAFGETGKIMVDAPPMAAVFPLQGRRFKPGVEAEYAAILDDGNRIVVRYLARPDRSFLCAPAWELDYQLPLIGAICHEMRRQL